MAASSSLQALAFAMSRPAAIEDEHKPTAHNLSGFYLPLPPHHFTFKNEIQQYYPTRESLICPEYGYAIAHCRRKITQALKHLLDEHCKHLTIPFDFFGPLICASPYYSSNRTHKMLIEDSCLTSYHSYVKILCNYLSSSKENIYRSILESVIDIIRKRDLAFIKPTTGLLSHIPEVPLMNLFNFAKSYLPAISNGILENCPTNYTQDTLEKIIFNIQKKYYGVEFLCGPVLEALKEWFLEETHFKLNEKSFLEEKLTPLDFRAGYVLNEYKKGIYVSATPLWDSSGKNLLKEINEFLIPMEKTLIDVNPIISDAPFDITLKNQTFLIFHSDDEGSHFKFDSTQDELAIEKEMAYEDVIGIGFCFTEEMDLLTLKDLTIQTISLALDCQMPAFFYHPYLGLKHIPATRLLDMVSSSPVMDLEKTMQENHIVWQKPQMKFYEALNPEFYVFSFEQIRIEDKENDRGKAIHSHANDDKISFTFSFRYLQTSPAYTGKIKWVNNIIPVIQLGPKLYLDRDNKIRALLHKRKEFYLMEIFTRQHEWFKKALSQLNFLLQLEYQITDLTLTPYSFQNSISIQFGFRGPKEKNVKLFKIKCKNNSILDRESAYVLTRRLQSYLEDKRTNYAPDKLLNNESYPFIKMRDLAISLSLYDLNKELIVKIFEKINATPGDTFSLESKQDLNLFLDVYLNRCEDISSACKAHVIVSILQQSLHLELDQIARCLIWCAANERHDELNQLTSPTIMTLRSNLLSTPSPSSEMTAALLVLARITPSTPPPLPRLEAKLTQAIAIAPPNAPLVVLPIPKPSDHIESKQEEKKEELKKILWQGKEINQETPLAVVVQYALDQYYLKPYPGQPEKLINRRFHGGTHAIMTVLLVDLFKELFKKYYPDFLIDPLTQKNRLSDEEDKLVYLMALYHDSGNTSENQNAETDQTVHADHFYRDVIKMGFSIEASQKCRLNMIHKDNKDNQNIGKVILHDADCLEFLRCSSKEDYDLTRLNIYHLIKNNCPSATQAFQEDIENIINYYSFLSTIVYHEKIQKNFESKELNPRTHFYTHMKEEITHYRLIRMLVATQHSIGYVGGQVFSIYKKSILCKLYSSLPWVLFYSHKESDDNKIKAMYFDEQPEIILKKNPEEKEDKGDETPSSGKLLPMYRSLDSIKALGSREKFEGPFMLRGIREYSKETTVWDQNLTILREEKISDLLALRKRYDINPLQNFRFRPATLILANVSVKSYRGDFLYILLKPSAVSFWGGFKKTVFSDYFQAKDFAFNDALPKRTIKTPTSTVISSKVKTLQTIEALQIKLEEMEKVRRGQKLSHHYRYFGDSALPANEVFIMNQDSLSASIEAIGICCDLKSSTWWIDVAAVAQEILTLSPLLPHKIRYFFYLAEKGLIPLTLEQIALIAKGRILSDLKSLGLVEGLDLFNLPRHKFKHIRPDSPTLESKEGDLENLKFGFKIKTSESVRSGHAFMRAGIPCIQVESDIYFDSEGVFRALARQHNRANLSAVQLLLPHFYWECLSLFQMSNVWMDFLPGNEEKDKDILRLSFRIFGGNTWDAARSLLAWMGYPVAQDKLRFFSRHHCASGEKVELLLSYPQALAHVQQTLKRHREAYYKELNIEEKLIDTFTSWNQLPTKHKNLLTFCKILSFESKIPSREDAIFSAINDIVPSFKEIPVGCATGIMKLFNLCPTRGWTEDQLVRLITQFLFVLQTHCPISLHRIWEVIVKDTPDSLFFALTCSKRLEEIKLIECPLERIQRIIIQGKDYGVESAMAFVVKHVESFSLDQLTQMLWTFIWKKKTDLKLIGFEGLLKIEKRFREKEASSSLSLHVMHSLLCGKQRELETKGEKPPALLSTLHSPHLLLSRKRKTIEVSEENNPKHSRSPTDSLTTTPP